MNTPLSCGGQDLLEAAIVQKRRLNIRCVDAAGYKVEHHKVLPVDIGTRDGIEWLTILTTDNQGGILKIKINTADIHSFQARDFLDPAIKYP
jgi:hypothetical protein